MQLILQDTFVRLFSSYKRLFVQLLYGLNSWGDSRSHEMFTWIPLGLWSRLSVLPAIFWISQPAFVVSRAFHSCAIFSFSNGQMRREKFNFAQNIRKVRRLAREDVFRWEFRVSFAFSFSLSLDSTTLDRKSVV